VLFDLVQLRTFVAVAEEQHLTRAAERLHMSLSAASSHVRAVEDAMGSQLFLRTNRNLELTRAGRLLFERCKSLLNEATLLATFAREIRGEVEGDFVIGTIDDPRTCRLGEIVTALVNRHPQLRVDLRARPSSNTRQGLRTGELDVGFFMARPTDPEFSYYLVNRVGYRVAGPVAWRSRIENADVAQLARLPWIVPSGTSVAYETMLTAFFGHGSEKLRVVSRYDSSSLGRAMMEGGLGLMLVVEERAITGVDQGQLVSPAQCRVEYPLYLAHLASRADDPPVLACIEAARSVWPSLSKSQD